MSEHEVDERLRRRLRAVAEEGAQAAQPVEHQRIEVLGRRRKRLQLVSATAVIVCAGMVALAGILMGDGERPRPAGPVSPASTPTPSTSRSVTPTPTRTPPGTVLPSKSGSPSATPNKPVTPRSKSSRNPAGRR